jgi:hypothetical protein
MFVLLWPYVSIEMEFKFIYLFGGIGVWTQAFLLIKQALYCLNYASRLKMQFKFNQFILMLKRNFIIISKSCLKVSFTLIKMF